MKPAISVICRIASVSTLLAFAFALHAPASAQAANSPASAPSDPLKTSITQYKIDTWQTDQGLPQNTVQTMHQTRAGYLWVGTASGLARFDGIRFATFETSPFPELVSKPIYGFMEDMDGTLWVGTGRNGRFEPAFDTDVTLGRRVWAFVQTSEGVIWIASESGLVRWEKGKRGGKDIVRLYGEADGLPNKKLRSLTFDKDGTLWIGTTGGGLVSFAAEKFRVWNPSNGFPHLEVRHVLADPAGGIWAATAGAGLVRIEGEKIKTYTTADGLPTDQLTTLARDKAGALWIGTWGAGLVRMSEGRFASVSTASGLAGDQIWSLQVDREGGIWVGTWNAGLNRLSSRAFGVLGKPEGLLSDNVRSVIHARDGATWIATSGGGVHRREGDRLTTFGKKDGLATDESSSLYEDRDGAIWIGSYTAGLSRLKPGGAKPAIENFGTAKGIPNLDVRAVLRDRNNILWVGTKSGLARFDETTQSFTAVREPGAPTEGVGVILEDRAGTLWFGTSGAGLVRYRQGTFDTLTRKHGLVSEWILALYEDANGSLWIGTNGEGMNRFANDRMTPIRTGDGLWDATVQVIIEDRKGDFWMTCNRGFYRVPRAELDAFAEGRLPRVTSTSYGPGDALRSTTFAGGLQPAGAIDAKGLLWLPSLMGLITVDPARLPGTGNPPPVMIEEVTVNGVNGAVGAGGSANRAIVLPPGSVPLSIRYSAATLLNADRVRFRYQMEGMTQDWIEAGKSREAAFPALPHGSYFFRVAASTDGKHWQEAAEALPITVKPHYY
ncbi:MAG: two-component regulator propeller domain-containing protein, partial [Usitatibacteraceae bacterium]